MSAILFASRPIRNVLLVPDVHRCIYISDALSISNGATSSLHAVKVIEMRVKFSGWEDSHGRLPYAVLRIGLLGSTVYAQHAARLIADVCEKVSETAHRMPYEAAINRFENEIMEVTESQIKGVRVDTGDTDQYTNWAVPIAIGPNVWEVSYHGVHSRRAPFYNTNETSIYSNGAASVYLEPAFRAAVNIYKSNYGDIWQTPAHRVENMLRKVASAVSDSTNTVGRRWDIRVVDTDGLGRPYEEMMQWELNRQEGAANTQGGSQ